MLTVLELSEVNGKPQVKLDLPVTRVGERVRLRFTLRRKTGGRHEVLRVDGQFRVGAYGIDSGRSPQRQVLTVEAVGTVPTWTSVKKEPEWQRALPVARAPRTVIE